MKILYDWLKEFVEVTVSPEDLRSRLSLSGTAIDAIEQTAAGPLLDAEITINRADCMGHYGVAREVATLYRAPLKAVQPKLQEAAEPAASAVRVEIEAPELCGRYTARVLRGVKVQPSPDWLRRRLAALGQNSINNVVDATNYVMLELGQPLHAFDLDRIAGHRIIVRRAKNKEKLKTLDGAERILVPGVCVIADVDRAQAIGGVMGGQESEIDFASRNLLIESAWFDSISIRRASKTLGLRTEASARFERGCDPEMAEVASRRCAELIQQLAGGELLSGVVDVYPGRREPAAVLLSRHELLRVMGGDVPDCDIEEILSFLGFEPHLQSAAAANSPEAVWRCKQPSWRADVTREIDLIEEVARHYGLEKFAARLPATRQPAARLPHAEALDRLRERLLGLGYQEILTIPLVDPARDALFRAEEVVAVHIANPLAEDASVMRSNGLGNMTAALEWNLNRGQRNLRLFEIGRAYHWNAAEGNSKEIREDLILTLGATGLAREKSVSETPREFTFADLKGDLDRVGELAGDLQWSGGGPAWLQPSRAATISIDSADGRGQTSAGVAGQLSRKIAEALKLRQDVFLAELRLDSFYAGYSAAQLARRYQTISRFPAVERDFSLLLGDGTSFGDVVKEIHSLGIPEIIQIEAVDLFHGGQVPAGKFSLLVRVTYQSTDATLTESQLSDFSSRIVNALTSKLGASLRAG
ncbi:MAG TPA: phenylalanine--tRNA ligase subunit beta [Candidatus Acidoferrales bacterium]|nr:phenylalanine--tRNA ligase subunit beta [Candidatus Acidoferrales bacterium]